MPQQSPGRLHHGAAWRNTGGQAGGRVREHGHGYRNIRQAACRLKGLAQKYTAQADLVTANRKPKRSPARECRRNREQPMTL